MVLLWCGEVVCSPDIVPCLREEKDGGRYRNYILSGVEIVIQKVQGRRSTALPQPLNAKQRFLLV
jgi:hypothetical protein